MECACKWSEPSKPHSMKPSFQLTGMRQAPRACGPWQSLCQAAPLNDSWLPTSPRWYVYYYCTFTYEKTESQRNQSLIIRGSKWSKLEHTSTSTIILPQKHSKCLKEFLNHGSLTSSRWPFLQPAIKVMISPNMPYRGSPSFCTLPCLS